MSEVVYINGQDAYQRFGVTFPPEAINAIRTPFALKSFIENESREEHGIRIINHNPKVDKREITIEMHLSANNDTQFEERYNQLMTLFLTGIITIRLRNTNYNFVYQSCNQFSQVGNIAKFVLKLVEPNPMNR